MSRSGWQEAAMQTPMHWRTERGRWGRTPAGIWPYFLSGKERLERERFCKL